ncbi:MAG: hypothetical protein M3014_10415 [Chloroflexota bacterium]|nr:hypothetical protein [Chloroflexota bacterium]
MIREVIFFELKLGPETDRFRELFRKVLSIMEAAGVEPGSVWTNVNGTGRYFIVEREFASLAQYEQDDAAFHGDKELMTTWRQMEECLISMRVDLWKQLRPRPGPVAE